MNKIAALRLNNGTQGSGASQAGRETDSAALPRNVCAWGGGRIVAALVGGSGESQRDPDLAQASVLTLRK